MKKIIKEIIMITIGITVLTGTAVYARNNMQKIDAYINKVQIELNGSKVKTNTITYKGVTYVSIDQFAEKLGKEVQYSKDKKIVNVKNKKINKTVD